MRMHDCGIFGYRGLTGKQIVVNIILGKGASDIKFCLLNIKLTLTTSLITLL